MTDYRKMPLGPVANRTGEVVECPHCQQHGLKVEDYVDPASGSKEKYFIYVHVEGGVQIRDLENGRIVDRYEFGGIACPIKVKSKSPEETPPG
jgi:hypothetical protein